MVDLKQSFGATGDGVADDGPELTTALTSIMASGRSLFVPKGTYLATTWTPLAITGPIRIRMEAGAVLKIPGTTQFFASGPTAFFDFDIEGGEIDMDTGGRIAEWRGHSAGSSILPLLRLVDVTIRNVINAAAPTEASAKCFDMWDTIFDRILIQRVEIDRCEFIGGTIAFELWGIYSGNVKNSIFRNQTYLGFSSNRATTGLTSLHESRSGRIAFEGCKFYDTLNTSAAADTHGLMLFGAGYTVHGCHFGSCRSANANGNCEGFYSKGHDIQIIGNTFEDAGGQRGFIVLKGVDFLDTTPSQQHPEGYSIIIANNTLRCTDAFVTGGPPNTVAIHLEAINVLVNNNILYNFGVYRTITVDSEQFDDGGSVAITNNLIVDCGSGNDSIVLQLSFLGTLVRLFVHDNIIRYHQRIGGRIIYLENATCHASIKRNHIQGHGTTAATKGIWIRSTGTAVIASADVTDNRFVNCTAGFEASGGSNAIPLLIHGRNRNATTGAIQETITSTVTANIAD